MHKTLFVDFEHEPLDFLEGVATLGHDFSIDGVFYFERSRVDIRLDLVVKDKVRLDIDPFRKLVKLRPVELGQPFEDLHYGALIF